MENKETFEEAIGRYPRYIENPPNINALLKWEEDKEFQIKQQCFIDGAKWQAERMYSEENMEEYAEFCIRCYQEELPCLIAKDWFSQFKKTKDGK